MCEWILPVLVAAHAVMIYRVSSEIEELQIQKEKTKELCKNLMHEKPLSHFQSRR